MRKIGVGRNEVGGMRVRWEEIKAENLRRRRYLEKLKGKTKNWNSDRVYKNVRPIRF